MAISSSRRRKGPSPTQAVDSRRTAEKMQQDQAHVKGRRLQLTMLLVFCLVMVSIVVWYAQPSSKVGRRTQEAPVSKEATHYDYDVLEVMPHDPKCFTQGLEFDTSDGALIESCGWWKESRITKNGKVIYRFKDEEFAEGITIAEKGKIHALTWRNYKAYIIDLETGKELKAVDYPHIGWGLTYDPERKVLYSTDGSDILYTLAVQDFSDMSQCKVKVDIGDGQDRSVGMLNELEWVDGIIYANIFMNVLPPVYPYYIVGIDPSTCRVTKILNFRGIHEPSGDLGNNVMNGIAKSNTSDGDLIVTGKRWNKMYRVSLNEMTSNRRRPKSHNQHPLTDFIARGAF